MRPPFAGAAARAWPRVLHAIDPGAAGEVDRTVATLLRESARQGAPVAAAVVVDPGSPAISEWLGLEAEGVRVFCYAIPLGRYLRHRTRYREAIREWRPALVHCHGPRADILAGSAAWGLRVPRVSTVHGFLRGTMGPRLAEWWRRRSLSRFDAVIGVSRGIMAEMQRAGVAQPRLHLIRDALPASAPPLTRSAARAELGLPEDATVLGWAGRLNREDGVDILLDALPWLADLQLTVSILGDGAERPALEETARRLGVAGCLRWHGNRRESARLFTAFDCFALSPRGDEVPRSLLIAMAAGVPVVAAAVGDVADLVRDGEGMRVAPAAPAALALAIRATLTGRAAALERAARARLHVTEDFAVGPWVTRHGQLYRDILTARLGEA
jgi:glycosyltransferase involved in cell wall biosynthesis